MSVHLSTMNQPSCRVAGQALLRVLGFSVASTLALRTRARAPAISALTAITRALAHRALARSTAHLALHFLIRHDALYSTELRGSGGRNHTDRSKTCSRDRAPLTPTARRVSNGNGMNRFVRLPTMAPKRSSELERPTHPDRIGSRIGCAERTLSTARPWQNPS